MANATRSFGSNGSMYENSTTGDMNIVIYRYYFERQIIAALLIIAATMGIVGNSLVILAVVLSKKLRTLTNVFVVNLSVADLLSCLSLPWEAISILSEDGWPLPHAYWICVATASLLILCIGCSLNNLTFIALSRWMGITKQRQTGNWMSSPRNLFIIVALAWLIPCSCIMVPLVSDLGELGYDEVYGSCTWNPENKLSLYFNFLLFFVFYPLQLLTIVFCYVSIFRYVSRNIRKMTNVAGPGANSISAKVGGTSVTLCRQLMKRQIDVTKNLVYIVLAFVLSQTLYFVLLPVYTDWSYRIYPYVTVCMFTNCCVNPIIYAASHPNFKEAFGFIVRCRWKEIPQTRFSRRYRSSSAPPEQTEDTKL